MKRFETLNVASMSNTALEVLALDSGISADMQREVLARVMSDYERTVAEGHEMGGQYYMPQYAVDFAGNASLLPEILDELSKVNSEYVWGSLCANEGAPGEFLANLATNPRRFQFSLAIIIDNPSCPRSLALDIALDDERRCEDDVLEALSQYPHWTASDLTCLKRAGVPGFESVS